MSKEQNKNFGKSIRTKLLNVARKENVFNQTILTRYFQERLLYRISQTHYRGNFYLKGGALMYAYEKFAARPTLDIDFLGNNISNEGSSIIAAFREICSVPYEEDGVIFDTEHITAQNITEFKDYHGIRLSVPVKMDTIAQVLTMDIGFGDVVTPSPIDLDYPALLEHLPSANILAYSLETVIAEKMHAIVDLADQSSRMKDYYDLYKILQNEKYNPITVEKFLCAMKQADKLYKETNLRLNPIYLYYNFVEIEKKHNIYQAGMRLSYAITEIGKMEQEAFELKSKKADDVSEEMNMLIKKELLLFEDLSKNLDIYINSLVDMQIMLRKQYQKYGA